MDPTTSAIFRWFWLVAAGLAWLTGCHSGVVRPENMPASLIAQPTTNVRSLDLSRLASGQHNSRHLAPGDKLEMHVVTGAQDDPKDPWRMIILEDGMADVPLVGPMRLAGLDVQQAQAVIREASIQRGIYLRPTIYVNRIAQKTNRVTVSGAVESPGTYELPINASDLLAAIVAAGGVKQEASPIVKIQRSGNFGGPSDPFAVAQASYPSTDGFTASNSEIQIDLTTLTRQTQRVPVLLNDGDVVVVSEQTPRYVHVIGIVRSPGQYEIRSGQDLRVLDAIAMGGGPTLSIADKVIVLRENPQGGNPSVIQISIRKAKKGGPDNLLLQDHDVVSVEETPTTFVLGAIRDMIRFGVNGSVAAF